MSAKHLQFDYRVMDHMNLARLMVRAALTPSASSPDGNGCRSGQPALCEARFEFSRRLTARGQILVCGKSHTISALGWTVSPLAWLQSPLSSHVQSQGVRQTSY